ncbi:MAG: hypothetical protein HYW07_04215 [Candidatus Latescibacteria bacterium]|nr:hypothetical protein [Candidatus Latescibacterota bacterium]
MYLHFSRLWVKVASFSCLAIAAIAIPALYLGYQWDLQMATEAYVHHLHGAALAVKAVIKQESDAAAMQAVLNEALSELRRDEMSLMEHQAPSFEVLQAYVVGPDSLVRASTEPGWTGRPIEEALLLTGKALATGNIQVVKEYGEGPLLVAGDTNQLEQVFMNLLQNAAQAMAKGGVLTIRTRTTEGLVEVSIADTGCGIPEEHLGRIFDSFFSTKGEKGTGLGLAICKRIAEEHGGKIEVESQVGIGTTMYVSLPAAPPGTTFGLDARAGFYPPSIQRRP